MRNTHRAVVGWRRLAAALCLFAWVQAAGLMPALLAFSATLEGLHEVSMTWERDKVSVVLHHHAQPGSEPHSHAVASRIVCSLGGSAPAARADHIADFTGAFPCEECFRVAPLALADSATLLVLYFEPSSAIPTRLALVNVTRSYAMASAPLHAQRTTLLLI